jgi:hypothetical protein
VGIDSIYNRLSSSSPGVGFDIVGVLRAYGRALPIDFLGHVTRRTAKEIQEAVKALAEEGSVVMSEGGLVALGKDKVAESSAREQAKVG